jgi:hypothetical protein
MFCARCLNLRNSQRVCIARWMPASLTPGKKWSPFSRVALFRHRREIFEIEHAERSHRQELRLCTVVRYIAAMDQY